jgi:hypothetical protein
MPNQLISKQKRNQIEALIYQVFDTIDKSGTNSDYYKRLFADMSDNDFYKFLQRRLPFRFHTEIFKVEPKMYDIFDAFKLLNKPLLEKVNVPHVFTNDEGIPIQTKECVVVYIHLKRLKQTVAKKTHIAIDIDHRDMRTGLLTKVDKGGKETDREFESLAVMGLEYNMDEFSRSRADALKAVSQMNNVISTKGFVSEKDIDVENDDSLAKNMLNVYLLGAHIMSNLVTEEYMTPYTLRQKKQAIERK